MTRRRIIALALGSVLARAGAAGAQSGRQVKVLLEFTQQAQASRRGVQGQGGIIVEERRGGPRPRGRGGLTVEDTTTRVTRSSGLFTVVQDGGVGSILVAQDVPYHHVAYYHDYVTGRGHVARGVAWERVGTALAVRPVILPGNRIRVTLTPVISYFTPGGGGTIEIVEAATELIAADRARLHFAGGTGALHSITREVLGYRSRQSSEETALTLTATIQ